MIRAPKQRIWALLCFRESPAEIGSETQAARIPWILFAAIDMPNPDPQIKRPSESEFFKTSWHRSAAISG